MNKVELKQERGISRSKESFELKINGVKVDIINYKFELSDAGIGPIVATFKMYADPKNSVIDIKPSSSNWSVENEQD